MAAARADPGVLPGVLAWQRAHLLRQLHALAEARAAAPVEALLITAAELHTRAELGVVDAAEKTLASGSAAPAAPAAAGQSAPGVTSPQGAAG
jgi:hypothetical protein